MRRFIPSFTHFIPFFPLPATIIGVYTMIYFDVPTSIWLINLTFCCIGILLALFISHKPILPSKINPFIVLAACVVLLLATFYGNGILNVHRWLNFGSLQINIGLIVCPLILIQISRISNPIMAAIFCMLITIIFLLQPDASLVSAFGISSCFILFPKKLSKLFKAVLLLFIVILIGYTWYNLDGLAPVSYVEDILSLTSEISMALFFVSMISLLLLIFPFIFYRKEDRLSISVGIYFSILLFATFIGHFPVMLMGYGISPIIGYFIGLIWMINTNSLKSK